MKIWEVKHLGRQMVEWPPEKENTFYAMNSYELESGVLSKIYHYWNNSFKPFIMKLFEFFLISFL